MPAINFLGFYVAQSWGALNMLCQVLNDEKDITRIVELGTGSGGLTLLLGLNMLPRNGAILTFDTGEPVARRYFPHLNITFERRDVFQPETINRVKEFIMDWRTLLICDDGDKPQEFRTYAPLLKPNDLIVAHDWKTEIKPSDLLPETLSLVEPYRQEDFDGNQSFMLSMRRR